jgi:hypothetical protein
MRRYRCYFLNSHNRIVDVAIVAGRDDDDIRKQALDLLATRAHLPAIEVWDLDRYVLHRSRPSRECVVRGTR